MEGTNTNLALDFANLQREHEILRSELSTANETTSRLRDQNQKLEAEKETARDAVLAGCQVAIEDIRSKKEELESENMELVRQADANNENWSRISISLLSAGATGEGIQYSVLRPMLEQREGEFLSPEAFGTESSEDVRLATMGFIGAPDVGSDDVGIIELLRICYDLAPHHLPKDDLGLLLWMDECLVPDILFKKKTDTWMTLTFHILSSKVCSATAWLARSLACVRLSSFASRYPMKDRDGWTARVRSIVERFPQRSVDRSGQTCLAVLALTTDDAGDLLRLLSDTEAPFLTDRTPKPIPEMIADKVSEDGQDGEDVVVLNESRLQLVIVRLGSEEIVFANQNKMGWMCSMKPLEFVNTGNNEWRVFWGEKNKGQKMRLTRNARGTQPSPLQRYFQRFHTTDMMSSMEARIKETFKKATATIGASRSMADA